MTSPPSTAARCVPSREPPGAISCRPRAAWSPAGRGASSGRSALSAAAQTSHHCANAASSGPISTSWTVEVVITPFYPPPQQLFRGEAACLSAEKRRSQPRTKLTSRPGTATTRRIGRAVEVGRRSSRRRGRRPPEPRRRRRPARCTCERTLPLTWTATCTVSSTSQRSSATGNGAQASEPVVAQPRPQLLGQVRGQRRHQQHQRLDDRPRHRRRRAVGLRQVVGQLGDAGDGDVEPQRRAAVADAGDGPVQRAQRLLGGLDVVGGPHRAGLLVDHHAPDPLQQPLRADDGLGLPRPRLLQRPGRHLVHAEGVGPVGADHLVRRDHVLQALADLPVLAVDRLALVEELAVLLHDLGGGHVEAALVGVGVGGDVALVDQPAERLLAGDVAQVVQHLVPEAGVQQVQHGVLDTADVQVDAADVALARAGPSSSAPAPGRPSARRRPGPGSAGSTSTSRPSWASCWSRGGTSSGRRPGPARPSSTRWRATAAARARSRRRRRRRSSASSRRPRAAAPAASTPGRRRGRSSSS